MRTIATETSMRTIATETSMRTIAASIIVLSGAVITAAWLLHGDNPFVLLGLIVMGIGGWLLLRSWHDDGPK